MDISQQIREMEKKAKEADYWKERFEALRDKVKDMIKELNIEVGSVKIPKTREGNLGQKIAEEIYIKLKTEQLMEIKGTQIEKFLVDKGLSESGNNVWRVTNFLKNMDGIMTRKDDKDSRTLWYYYLKTSDIDEEVKDLKEALPNKFS